jgi:predicted Zn-dependent protease
MKQAFILFFTIAIISSCNSKSSNESNISATVDTTGYSLKSIEGLHERITFSDQDKTLFEYIDSKPNKVDETRKVVYLLPFGNMKPEVEEIVRNEVAYLEAFLQLNVKVMDRIPYDSIRKMSEIETRMVPSNDFDHFSKMKGGTPNLTEQIEAGSFQEEVLKKNKPTDAIAVLGITEHDIYKPKYNYLFGTSSLKEGVGLVSTFRLIDYGAQTKFNIRKVVSKQIVNMFSISNVKDYKCVMNFHNSIEQLFKGGFNLSPRALEKLKYAIGFDYTKRFEDLKEFWKKEDYKTQVNYYENCLNKTSVQEK